MSDDIQKKADDTVAAPANQQEQNTDTGTEHFVVTTDDSPVFQLPPEEDESETEAETPADKAEASESGEDDESGKKTRYQKRIDKLVSEREAEKINREKLEKQLQELQSKSEEAKELKPDDFDTYDEYLDAIDARAANSDTDKKETKESESQEKEPDLTEDQRIALAMLKEKFDDHESKPDDFYDVVESQEVPITPAMIEALAACENAADVAYNLAKNKQLAKDIASGSVAQQMRSIAKLDFEHKAKPQKPANISKTPDPISPVGGSVDASNRPLTELSFSEYEARRISQEKAASSDGW